MKKLDDPIVEEVHQTREHLLNKHGGSEGYAQHIREIEAELESQVVARSPRAPAIVRRKVS